MNLQTKAYLLSVGRIAFPGYEGDTSSAGPGAGSQSLFFRSGDLMVRLSVDPSSPLQMVEKGGEAVITEAGREITRGHLVEPLAHCPEQAYITISERCIYDCRFCAVPKIQGGVKSLTRVKELVETALRRGELKAIALTSGVEVSPEQEVERVAGIVRELRDYGLPIGVSVCPTPDSNRILKAAGAVEVKYNVETVDPDLFSLVCPGLSLGEILEALHQAVDIFGPGHVTSNIIVGLGETDAVLRQGIDEMVQEGVLPVLRAVYPHPLRVGDTSMIRPSAGRMINLARYLRRAMDRQGLRGDLALTMCYRCTGCDLIPHRDL